MPLHILSEILKQRRQDERETTSADKTASSTIT
jgi:hypothetical protein